MTGMNPDFSDDTARGRFVAQASGLAPHLRFGHSTPDQPPPQAERAQAAIDAIRRPPSDGEFAE